MTTFTRAKGRFLASTGGWPGIENSIFNATFLTRLAFQNTGAWCRSGLACLNLLEPRLAMDGSLDRSTSNRRVLLASR